MTPFRLLVDSPRYSRSISVIGLMAAALLMTSFADAQERSRLSRGLADKLTAGAPEAKVIYEGPQDEVDRLAGAYGLSVEKRLPSGAVLGGSAARMRRLAQDPSVGYLS